MGREHIRLAGQVTVGKSEFSALAQKIYINNLDRMGPDPHVAKSAKAAELALDAANVFFRACAEYFDKAEEERLAAIDAGTAKAMARPDFDPMTGRPLINPAKL